MQNGGITRYLGPQQEFSSFWTSLADGDATKVETQIQVTCRYKAVTGSDYTVEQVLDLSELKGSSQIGEPPLLKIGKHLEKMQSDLHSLVTGFKRLGVDTYNEADRAAERKELQERIAEFKQHQEPGSECGAQ